MFTNNLWIWRKKSKKNNRTGKPQASHIFINMYEIIDSWLVNNISSPRSPNLALSDYHLLLRLQSFLIDKSCNNNYDLKLSFILHKTQKLLSC